MDAIAAPVPVSDIGHTLAAQGPAVRINATENFNTARDWKPFPIIEFEDDPDSSFMYTTPLKKSLFRIIAIFIIVIVIVIIIVLVTSHAGGQSTERRVHGSRYGVMNPSGASLSCTLSAVACRNMQHRPTQRHGNATSTVNVLVSSANGKMTNLSSPLLPAPPAGAGCASQNRFNSSIFGQVVVGTAEYAPGLSALRLYHPGGRAYVLAELVISGCS